MLSATEVAFVMLAAMQLVLALLWALGAWWIAGERRATLHWAAFAAFSALMFVLLALALRADPPHAELLRAAGNVSGVVAMLALQRGVWCFIGRAVGWRGHGLALAAVLVAAEIGLDPAYGWLRVGACAQRQREQHEHQRAARGEGGPVQDGAPFAGDPPRAEPPEQCQHGLHHGQHDERDFGGGEHRRCRVAAWRCARL